MLRLKVVIDCEGEAFEPPHTHHEAARLLREVAATLAQEGAAPRERRPVRDQNGNRCGWWRLYRARD